MSSMMVYLIIVSAVALCVIGCASERDHEFAALEGAWYGESFEKGVGPTWVKITITLLSGGNISSTWYYYQPWEFNEYAWTYGNHEIHKLSKVEDVQGGVCESEIFGSKLYFRYTPTTGEFEVRHEDVKYLRMELSRVNPYDELPEKYQNMLK